MLWICAPSPCDFAGCGGAGCPKPARFAYWEAVEKPVFIYCYDHLPANMKKRALVLALEKCC